MSPTPSYIFNHFPLCQVRSSFGNICKHKPFKEAYWFTPRHIAGLEKVTVEGSSLILETEGWFYEFIVHAVTEKSFRVDFNDSSKFGSYFSVSSFHVEEGPSGNWIIAGETPIYLRGPDAESVDIYQSGVDGRGGRKDFVEMLPVGVKNPLPFPRAKYQLP